MENIIISNPKRFEFVKQEIIKEGLNNLHILADFDRTLTTAFVDGKEVTSLISILRDHNYLTPDYPDKARALSNQYYPIELDASLPKEERIKAMHEWWSRHFQLLIASRLNKKDIASAAESGHVQLREGSLEFFDFLKRSEEHTSELQSQR